MYFTFLFHAHEHVFVYNTYFCDTYDIVMAMNLTNLYVCIIHYPGLNVRLQTVNNFISKITSDTSLQVKVDVIDAYNPDKITQDDVKAYVKLEKLTTNTIFDQLLKNLHIKQISNSLKHMKAMDAFLLQPTFDTMLVLEDDALFGDDIVEKLKQAIVKFHEATPAPDILLLGCPTPVALAQNTNTIVNVFESFKLIPTCESYLVSKASAKTIMSMFSPIRFGTSVHYSYLHQIHDLRVSMIIPNIFVNGSKYGVYVSALDPNNKLFMNNDYNQLSVVLAKNEPLTQETRDMVAALKKKPLGEHPDFLYLLALIAKKEGNFKEAKDILDKTYKIYKNNDSILNGESDFLRTYTSIFGHFQ